MAKVLVVCGATASGKTALSIALAKQLNTEIVSADSMLIYKGLDIGTAKPTVAEMDGIKHHMIDVVSPKESFSVSDYRQAALPIVEGLLAKEKTPIICGGTGFYINSLLFESQMGNVGADEKLRAEFEGYLAENGKDALHALLAEKDAESAAILHPNDTKRVIRALEIFYLTGRKKSEQGDTFAPKFDFTCVSIDYPRERLYDRINLRVDKMFAEGLEAEIDALLDNGVTKDCQCMQGIGYKEILEGREQGFSLEEIKELIKKNTRNYAKRQLTFFKRMPNHLRLSPDEIDVEKVLEKL
ncbi:MAG: tRNA (adenosine(37)-N6)-dimethylallyltransferase MiaA [Clostridia bacterium]|nr:tRNA (adenosine(37)-N6)-dimethylallyltransferase MiaA [Clostridia bacterium]